jgi:CubicO group peptidase (beta-lactamase class C family)
MNISSNVIDEIVLNTLERFEIPACSIAIVHQDEIIYKKGYGTRTKGKQETVDEHTVFALASISKSTAAACLGILVDEGKIRWDDPVRKYLPDFELYDCFATHEIQIRDLLIHNSGLPSVSGGTIWYGSTFTRAEIVSRLKFLIPSHSFRSVYAYQNIIFLVAGELIHAISGLSWDDFVQERIFEPLGMQRTKTRLNEINAMGNIATPHARIEGLISTIPYRNHENVGPAAAVNSTVWDWSQYLRMHLNAGNFAGTQILSAERIREFWEVNTPIPFQALPEYFQIEPPILNAYGFGWFISNYRDKKIVYHSGGVDGMRTMMTLIPQEKLGILVFTNMEAPGIGPITNQVIDYLLKYPSKPWLDWYDRYFQEVTEKLKNDRNKKENSRVLNTRSHLDQQAYCGIYQDRMVGNLSIAIEEGSLILRFNNNPAFQAQLSHWHFDTFKINWLDPYISSGWLTFQLNSLGEPIKILLDQPKLLDVDFAELDLMRLVE